MEGTTVADAGLWDRLTCGRGRTQFGSPRRWENPIPPAAPWRTGRPDLRACEAGRPRQRARSRSTRRSRRANQVRSGERAGWRPASRGRAARAGAERRGSWPTGGGSSARALQIPGSYRLGRAVRARRWECSAACRSHGGRCAGGRIPRTCLVDSSPHSCHRW